MWEKKEESLQRKKKKCTFFSLTRSPNGWFRAGIKHESIHAQTFHKSIIPGFSFFFFLSHCGPDRETLCPCYLPSRQDLPALRWDSSSDHLQIKLISHFLKNCYDTSIMNCTTSMNDFQAKNNNTKKIIIIICAVASIRHKGAVLPFKPDQRSARKRRGRDWTAIFSVPNCSLEFQPVKSGRESQRHDLSVAAWRQKRKGHGSGLLGGGGSLQLYHRRRAADALVAPTVWQYSITTSCCSHDLHLLSPQLFISFF